MPDPPRPKAPGTGVPLPPPRAKQTTFTGLPSALPKRPEQTIVGAAGPPSAGSAPGAPDLSELDAVTELRVPRAPADVAPQSSTLQSADAQPVQRERLPQGQPKRSVSPAPFELAPLSSGDHQVRVRVSLLRKLAPWIAPVALSVAGAVFGYFQGLKAAGERMAAAEERTRQHGEKLAALQARVVAQEEALAAEAASNRSERATRDRQINAIEDRLPKIQGLTPPKP